MFSFAIMPCGLLTFSAREWAKDKKRRAKAVCPRNPFQTRTRLCLEMLDEHGAMLRTHGLLGTMNWADSSWFRQELRRRRAISVGGAIEHVGA